MFKWQAIDKTNRDVPRLRDKGRLKGAEEEGGEGGEGGGDSEYKNKRGATRKSHSVFSRSRFLPLPSP